MVKNLNEVVTQAEFGEMVGLAQQTVSEFVARGVLKPGESAACWIASYCSRLREMAEARAAAGGIESVLKYSVCRCPRPVWRPGTLVADHPPKHPNQEPERKKGLQPQADNRPQ